MATFEERLADLHRQVTMPLTAPNLGIVPRSMTRTKIHELFDSRKPVEPPTGDDDVQVVDVGGSCLVWIANPVSFGPREWVLSPASVCRALHGTIWYRDGSIWRIASMGQDGILSFDIDGFKVNPSGLGWFAPADRMLMQYSYINSDGIICVFRHVQVDGRFAEEI